MTHLTQVRTEAASSVPDTAVPAVRAVRRAVLEARGGVPVVIDSEAPLVALPVETASPSGLAELLAAARGPAVLLLAPTRAAAVLHRPVGPDPVAAISLPPGPLAPELLLALADPTRWQDTSSASSGPLPPHADAALKLAKHGRLLPAIVVAPADPEPEPEPRAALGVEPAIVAASVFDATPAGATPAEAAAPGQAGTAGEAEQAPAAAATSAGQETGAASGAGAEAGPEAAGVTPDEPAIAAPQDEPVNAEGAASPETERPAAADGEPPAWP